MSLTAERARAVGGYHLHMMFCLPADKSETNVELVIDEALRRLASSPYR